MDEPGAPAPLIALTGATGFIGQQLQQRLLADGYRVRALVRPDSSKLDRLQPGCEAAPVQLNDRDALREVLADVSAVVYCAGSVRGRGPEDFAAANIDGLRHLASVSSALPTPPPVLLISSLAASRPQLSNYAQSKAEGERVLRQHESLAWTILRPPAVYGPGDKEMRPILAWLRRGIAFVPGPPGQRLSLLYVEDLASAVVAWLRAGTACRHQLYSVDDGYPGGYDWPGMARAVGGGRVRQLRVPAVLLRLAASVNWGLSKLFGYAPMLTPGKVRELTQESWVCDNEAFTRATGWTPAVDLGEGARRLFGAKREG
ncbi:MAG: NAD(P)-dependent oxidoreductase [Gammaproteobacteria bacterium]